MDTQTLPAYETSNVGYRGFQVSESLRWEGLRRSFGRQAYESSLNSQPLTVWLSAYFTGEDLLDHPGTEPSEEASSLPEGDKELGKALYLDCQTRVGLRNKDHPDHGVWKGVWFADAADYNAKTPASMVVPKGFRYVVYIKGVEGWEKTQGGAYVPQGGTRIPVEMPISKGHFAVPRGIHVYDQLTGVPKMVEPDRNKAVKAYRDLGMSENEAERRLSKVWSIRDSGIAVVGSYADPELGPLSLIFGVGPGDGSGDVGSVAASRLASGASRGSENVVPIKQYTKIASELLILKDENRRLRERDELLRGFEDQLRGLGAE